MTAMLVFLCITSGFLSVSVLLFAGVMLGRKIQRMETKVEKAEELLQSSAGIGMANLLTAFQTLLTTSISLVIALRPKGGDSSETLLEVDGKNWREYADEIRKNSQSSVDKLRNDMNTAFSQLGRIQNDKDKN